jgi:hypothetical protein
MAAAAAAAAAFILTVETTAGPRTRGYDKSENPKPRRISCFRLGRRGAPRLVSRRDKGTFRPSRLFDATPRRAVIRFARTETRYLHWSKSRKYARPRVYQTYSDRIARTDRSPRCTLALARAPGFCIVLINFVSRRTSALYPARLTLT